MGTFILRFLRDGVCYYYKPYQDEILLVIDVMDIIKML